MEDFQPSCEVQLVALSLPVRFGTGAQTFYFGLGFLHQLMAAGSGGTIICHENLQMKVSE